MLRHNARAEAAATVAYLQARELHRLEQREFAWRGRPEHQVRAEMDAALERWKDKRAAQRG